MKNIFVLLMTFLMPALSLAEQAPPKVNFVLAYGSEYRPEKDVDGYYAQHMLTNYSVGVGFDQYLLILERATFEESSGNATLNVTRKLEDSMVWGHWRSLEWNHLVPYLGGGTGFYRETIETRLLGASSAESRSPQKFLLGGCFGLNLSLPYLWLSLEGRLLFGDELDQQPTLGGLARIGFWL